LIDSSCEEDLLAEPELQSRLYDIIIIISITRPERARAKMESEVNRRPDCRPSGFKAFGSPPGIILDI
jgi:hypothetical protein